MASTLYVRGANLVLGAWLFLSSFCWTHSAQQFTNAWLSGLLIAAFALVSFWIPPARYANTALSVWLFISIWMLPRVSAWTAWNHALVAMAVLIGSLVPSASLADERRRIAPGSLTESPRTI